MENESSGFKKPTSRREVLGTLSRLAMGLWVSLSLRIPGAEARGGAEEEAAMKLPQPRFDEKAALEKALNARRTVRSFKPDPLSLEQFSGLLWAAQGITEERGFKRTAPSAGALYPLDIYAATGEGSVAGLTAGVYHYLPAKNSLKRLSDSDVRNELARASLGQMWMSRAPVNLVITAEYSRICGKYGDRGVRYAMIEAGHVGQNIFLAAEANGLGAGIVGAFNDLEVIELMSIPETHEPLLIMPVGYKA